MARNSRVINASPEHIFEVLSDPESYQRWVVGAKDLVQADAGWPAAGTAFEHRVGFGPLTVGDRTRVVDSDPPRFIKLSAKARPLGTAMVSLHIEPDGKGSLVRMTEKPGDSLTATVFNFFTDPLVRIRNTISLHRLAELAEGRASGRVE